MIGPEYQGKAMGALFGRAHSMLIPDVLWGAWLDENLAVLSETGVQVPHESLDVTGTGVVNTAVVDAGVIPAGAIAYFALMDAETGGNIVWYGAATFDPAPTVGEPFGYDVGALSMPYTEA